jgi:hypothetical protein
MICLNIIPPSTTRTPQVIFSLDIPTTFLSTSHPTIVYMLHFSPSHYKWADHGGMLGYYILKIKINSWLSPAKVSVYRYFGDRPVYFFSFHSLTNVSSC